MLFSTRSLDPVGRRATDDTPPRDRRRWGFRALAVSLAALMLSVGVGVTAANAATGDYTVEVTAPASIPIYDQFTYTATIAVEASTAAPATGIVLTSVLAEGLAFDSAPTGPDSPIESYSYDAATRTVTFVLKDLTDQLSSFTYSVAQVDNSVKDASTVYDTSILGSTTPSGTVPSANAVTSVTGDNAYVPAKSFTTIEGSNNRQVTYYFNLSTANGDYRTTETFTSWSQTLTDTLPAGAVVTATSTWGGTWATTANGDGSTTAVWHRDGEYGPSSDALDDVGGRIWIVVDYPVAVFAEGSLPPVNEVDLTVTDHSGTSFGPTSAEVQSLAFIDGATKSIYLTKDANRFGANETTVGNGIWQSDYVVDASFLNNLDADTLKRPDDAAAESVGLDQIAGDDLRRCRPIRCYGAFLPRHHGVTSRTRTTASAPSGKPSTISVTLPSVRPSLTSCGQNAPSA